MLATLNKRTSLIAAITLGNAGLLMIYFLPLLVGAVDEQYGLTEIQKGIFGASDLIGYSVASLSAFFWIRKVNWKTMAFLAIAILAIGNLISVFAPNFTSLLAIRIFTGLGQGIAVSIAITIFGDSDHTDRNFAIFLILSLLVGVFGLPFLPGLVESMGSKPIFLTQLFFALLALPFVIWGLPKKGLEYEESKSDGKLSTAVILALLGILIMYIGYGGLWVLVERFGDFSGLPASTIAKSLSASLFVGIFALLIPIVLEDKLGRLLPIGLSLLSLIVFALLLFLDTSATGYLIAVCAGNFGINVILPYITGVIDKLDDTGKGVVLVTPMYAIGITLGPIILALFITENSTSPAGYAAAGFFLVSLIIYFWIIGVSK
jgi:predicted MFS family arabinose efflux permease